MKDYEIQYLDSMNEHHKEMQKWINSLEPTKSNKNFSSIEAFERLIALRDEVRNGWRPNWRNMQTKYYIDFDYEVPKVKSGICMFHLFSFETLEQANKFLEDNRKLLEKIKQLY